MKAIVTVGIPCSGKTTWAENQTNFLNINLDDLREQISGNADNQEVTLLALSKQKELINQASVQGKDIIISDTNLKPSERAGLIELLKSLNFEIEIVDFPINPSIAKERSAKRSRQIPDYVMDRFVNLRKDFPLEKDFSNYQIVINGFTVSSEVNEIIQKLDAFKKFDFSQHAQIKVALSDYIKENHQGCFPKDNLTTLMNSLGIDQRPVKSYLELDKISLISECFTESENLVNFEKFLNLILPYDLSDSLKESILSYLKECFPKLKRMADENHIFLVPWQVEDLLKEHLKRFPF